MKSATLLLRNVAGHEAFQQQAAVEYGAPGFVASGKAWEQNVDKKYAPVFSGRGQVFSRETLPEKSRGMIALNHHPHDASGERQALSGLRGAYNHHGG